VALEELCTPFKPETSKIILLWFSATIIPCTDATDEYSIAYFSKQT
jgi:hypothetical protein